MAKQTLFVRKAVVTIIVLLILIPCAFLLYDAVLTSNEEKVEFYYMMTDGKMKPVERKIKNEGKEELLQAVLVSLQEGPKTDGAYASIPQNMEFLSIKLEKDTAVVNVSPAYYRMKNTEAVIFRSSVVWTLTSLDYVENVEMLVDGKPLLTKAGEEYGLMNRKNILIDSTISAETTEYAILKLYFANKDATDLAVEERVVQVNANQPREKTILEQLIAGPAQEMHQKVIPAETKIKDVTTTNDGTCYVNLSQEFVTKQSGTKIGELLTVYSIVNSLCALDHIEKVQFLIDGVKLDEYKGTLDFKTPFTAMDGLKEKILEIQGQ